MTFIRLFKHSPNPVIALRVIWIIVVAWYELGTFYNHVSHCAWPDTTHSLSHFNTSDTSHVLLVADPQILDHRSYPGRQPWLVWLSQIMVDLNLRKSWSAAKTLKPDALMFLGDMMDGGRFAMPDDEYESYYERFKNIFTLDGDIPVHYIPGNHDVGLGPSNLFSDRAQTRYTSHFGPLNQIIEFANHSFILLDAPGLVEEDYQRVERGVSYTHWAAAMPGGPIEFIQTLDYRKFKNAPILLTHIPLARPNNAPCGPLRERGTIRQGVGFGYQNTLNAEVSQLILEKIRPVAIFSGDDHDYCEYHHPLSASDDVPLSSQGGSVKEITVKSFSMAMGVRRPGFQLLSLDSIKEPQNDHASTSIGTGGKTLADSLCLLPDQLGIYLSVYVPFILFSLLVLFVSNFVRSRSNRQNVYSHPWSNTMPVGGDWRSTTPTTLDDLLALEKLRRQDQADNEDIEEDETMEAEYYSLPEPSVSSSYSSKSKKNRPRRSWSWSFVLWGRRRRMTIDSSSLTCGMFIPWFSSSSSKVLFHGDSVERGRQRGLVDGFLRDVLKVAWPPVVLFAVIAWWMFRD
ncbi:Metallo-dependent phosphatase-like protein [Abortiporus biennis]|nr:Metallo-dependent phosphatase-like protein [Abortiporus biennis]